MNFAGKDVEIGLEMGQVNKLDREPKTGTDQYAGQCVGNRGRPISRTESRKHGQTNKPETGTDQQAGQCVGIGTDHNTGHLSKIVDNCPVLRTISG